MDFRSRTSPEQFTALLEFMDRHGDIAKPQQGAQGRMRADNLWQELSNLLNSVGATKTLEKWKKVWADWKAKTKKKALTMRQEANGTSSSGSRQTLNGLEQGVLAIMGLSDFVGQVEFEEGFDEPQSNGSTLVRDSGHIEALNSQNDGSLDYSIGGSSTPMLEPVITLTMPSAASPAATATSEAPPPASPPSPSRKRRMATPSQETSPAPSIPRRYRHRQARTRRVQVPLQRAATEFVAIENRRLQLEEEREKNTHQREMRRLRLESRRLEIEESRNQVLNRLGVVLEKLTEILPALRASLPSTDSM